MKKQAAAFCAFVLVVLILVPSRGWALNTFSVGVTLADLGGGRYQYTWAVTNLGPDLDVIFKWEYTNIDNKWTNWSFDLSGAPGWTAMTSGPQFQSRTDNGDGTTPRIKRGETLTFMATFDVNGGRAPTADWSGAAHFQPVDNYTDFNNTGPTYKVSDAGVIPEPATLVLLGTGVLGLAGYRRFRRKT